MRFGNIFLIAPGTRNQFGGKPEDFAGLIGSLFSSREAELAFTLPEKNLFSPYAQQWHLTGEREVFRDYLISAAYSGTKGTKLTRLVTPNRGPNRSPTIPFVFGKPLNVFPGFPEVITSPKPFTALGPFQIFESSASSRYHSMQIETRKRYSRGYTLTLAYTWSHAIDDVSDLFPIAGAPVLAQDHTNFRAEKGNANFDVRHRFAASLVWDIPFYGRSKEGIRRLLAGWQLSSIFQAHTGQPFTLNLPVDANQDGNLTDRPNTTEGLIFFEGHSPRRVAVAPGKTINDFFSFTGHTGFVGRNTVRGDGFINLDLALSKNFALSDKQGLQFRAEVFNMPNRANFGLPIRTLGAPGFGMAVDTINPARTIQFALKFRF